MMRFLKTWRIFTVLAMALWFLAAALLGGFCLEGWLEGDFNRDDPLFQTFAEGGPNLSYADLFHSFFHVFLLSLLCLMTCAVSLIYQKHAIRAASWLPDGKWLLPALTAILHIASVIAYLIIF